LLVERPLTAGFDFSRLPQVLPLLGLQTVVLRLPSDRECRAKLPLDCEVDTAAWVFVSAVAVVSVTVATVSVVLVTVVVEVLPSPVPVDVPPPSLPLPVLAESPETVVPSSAKVVV